MVWVGMDLKTIQFHLQGHLPLLQVAPGSTQPGQFSLECNFKRLTRGHLITKPPAESSFISLGSSGNQAGASFNPSNSSCIQLPPSAFAPRTTLAHKRVVSSLERFRGVFGLSQGKIAQDFPASLRSKDTLCSRGRHERATLGMNNDPHTSFRVQRKGRSGAAPGGCQGSRQQSLGSFVWRWECLESLELASTNKTTARQSWGSTRAKSGGCPAPGIAVVLKAGMENSHF